MRRVAWLLGFGILAIVGTLAVKRVAFFRAHRYVVSVLDLIETHHVRRGQIDWARVRAEAYRRSEDATTPAQTHDAIRFALASIGDHHSGLIEADVFQKLNEFTVSDSPTPEGELLPDRIGYVRVPSFVGTSEAALTNEGLRIQHAIASVDGLHPCVWILDLRENGGGNMWPMLAGLAPLLGDGTVGGFSRPDGTVVPWSLAEGRVLEGNTARTTLMQPYRLAAPDPPVAVLLGHGTASSGEAVAIAFRGRPSTRSFGAHTLGYSTSNEMFALSDGAVLNLSVSTFTDRNGRLYSEGVEPDVSAEEGKSDAIPSTAREWLLSQSACRK